MFHYNSTSEWVPPTKPDGEPYIILYTDGYGCKHLLVIHPDEDDKDCEPVVVDVVEGY